MGKVRNLATLSSHYKIDPILLDKLGVLDPTLAIDIKLFIDPLLFRNSTHPEFHTFAVKYYRNHFQKVIKFLSVTKKIEDVAWRSARNLLEFHEISGTCLGYGTSIHGSGFGPELTARIMRTGKEIVDLGINDPDLFPSMALFEADIGPDRISDMATNVVIDALISYNKRIIEELGVEGEVFDILNYSGTFLKNPFQVRRTPIILIPKDILRKLPIAKDWYEIASAASKSEALRKRVNHHIGHIWATEANRNKTEIRKQALASKDAFQTLLDAIHGVPPKPYSVDDDPDGLVKWVSIGKKYAKQNPLILAPKRITDIDNVHKIVREIIRKFEYLVEHKGLSKELYKEDGRPRHEETAQRLFFTIAYCYCEANNVDISPEVDTGSGQIDFKLSQGFNAKVLVELKLSTNPKLTHGYEVQLEIYKQSEATMRAYYLVIDVGRMGKKDEKLIRIKGEAAERGEPLSDLVFIDGTLKASASKR